MDKRAVILGAGNVGRGFLGQLFSESGYFVTFVDIDEPLIDALRSRGEYIIRLVDNESTQEVLVGPVTGLLSHQRDQVAEALAQAALAATAVGARALSHIAPLVAAGIARRVGRGLNIPLNIIVCENLHNAAAIFREMVLQELAASDAPPGFASWADYLACGVGFVNTVIGRMVPELPPELRAQDPSLIIVEPYKELPVERAGFVGEIPPVVGMQPEDHFELFTARKLYLHNAGHAILGYLGYRRGYALGYEALEDALVRPILDGALQESIRGIVARYGAAEGWLREHVRDLLRRFANRALADPILRLARDPLRKLAPEDRLVGAARVAQEADIVPSHLAWGIAGALAFDAPSDPIAVELQRRIAQEGTEAVLHAVCAIDPQEPLGQAVLDAYQRLQREPLWQKT
ncbi:MAG: mannitol-1-phosphate 5-dehydrogenase [Chloroflexi bacterium]|nr:mannitol-1-phosphate 5-dehydrogenase [Chloroflexota bacterium]